MPRLYMYRKPPLTPPKEGTFPPFEGIKGGYALVVPCGTLTKIGGEKLRSERLKFFQNPSKNKKKSSKMQNNLPFFAFVLVKMVSLQVVEIRKM